jgi:hypothetical protein
MKEVRLLDGSICRLNLDPYHVWSSAELGIPDLRGPDPAELAVATRYYLGAEDLCILEVDGELFETTPHDARVRLLRRGLEVPDEIWAAADRSIATTRAPVIVLRGARQRPIVFDVPQEMLTKKRYRVIAALNAAGDEGMSLAQLRRITPGARHMLDELRRASPEWSDAILMAGGSWRGYAIRQAA